MLQRLLREVMWSGDWIKEGGKHGVRDAASVPVPSAPACFVPCSSQLRWNDSVPPNL